ncbi:MAG: hypothetical protein ACRED0_09855, partial [Gammaproteobacteria bacterium]
MTADTATANTEELIKRLPTLTELFGSIDLCDCQHCRSMYSPAAYFVDLLHFLGKAPKNSKGHTPFDVLVGKRDQNGQITVSGRRPDLEHIKLTCENTNTTMPYVDLVLEVLEYFVAHEKLDKDAAHDTGDTTSEALRANPQNFLADAYLKLKDAVYPFALPYHQPIEVARVYFEHLGSSRHEVMYTFRTDDTTASLQHAIHAEYLKLVEEEYRLITASKNFDPDPAAVQKVQKIYPFYGYETFVASNEKVWFKDSLPTGSTPKSDNESWTWITASPPSPSGARVHQSALVAGVHQHFFESATDKLQAGADDSLFTYVFLDPAHPPKEIMLQWNDGAWEHRAYWGENRIPWGVDGTPSRRRMGPLPPAGQWVRLEVPVYFVGLRNRAISGMAFTLYDGSAMWDQSGMRTASWQESLSHVPTGLQRTGISYVDLVELLKTRFINPNLPQSKDLEIFEKVPFSYATLAHLVQTNFAGLDENVLKQAGIDDVADFKDWATRLVPKLGKLIVLDSPNSACDLTVTRILHLDGSTLEGGNLGDETNPTIDNKNTELGKMHRFIRLWRKLGWSIAELDKAMTALKTAVVNPT